MKVAILIPGYLRGFTDTNALFRKSILNPTSGDVFVCTYDYIGFNRNDHNLSNRKTSDCLMAIRRLLRPKKLLILPRDEDLNVQRFLSGKPHQLAWGEGRDRWLSAGIPAVPEYLKSMHSVLGMFRNIQRCNELRQQYESEHNFKYSRVVRVRADALFRSTINTSDLQASDEAVYVPSFINAGGVNDQFAFGGAELMDRYCSVFDHIDEYFFNDGIDFWPEGILAHHLRKQKVPVRRTNINFVIRRGNGAITNQTRAP